MKKFIFALLACCAWWLGGVQPVLAASPNFTVKTELPSNQLDPNVHYFDLLVQPGSTQDLTLLLQNTDTGSHRFRISPNRATTSAAGQIDYSQHAASSPAGLAVDIETLLSKPKTVTVAPRSTKRVHVQLQVPKTAWSGILLGGIRIEKLDHTTGETQAGVGITNQVSVTVAVQLQATKTLPALTPQLQFHGVKTKLTTAGALVFAKLENPLPAIMHDITVTAAITQAGHSKARLKTTQSALNLAPNSTFALALNTTAKALPAGKYHLDLTATNGQQHWTFGHDFTIQKAPLEAAKQANQPAVTKHQSLPAWFVALLLAILAALIGAIIMVRRRQP